VTLVVASSPEHGGCGALGTGWGRGWLCTPQPGFSFYSHHRALKGFSQSVGHGKGKICPPYT